MYRWVFRSLVLLLTITFVQLVSLQEAAAQVIINEVMPNPSAASDKSEWVELYNYSTEAIDLRGWSLDGKEIEGEEEIQLEAEEFILLTKDIESFSLEFPEVNTDIVFEFSVSFSNSGDTVELSHLEYSDMVSYTATNDTVSWERKGPLCQDLIVRAKGYSPGEVNLHHDESCFEQEDTPDLDIMFSLNQEDWVEDFQVVGSADIHFKYILKDEVEVISSEWQDSQGNKIVSPISISETYNGSITLDLTTPEGTFTYESQDILVFPKLLINELLPNPEGVDAGNEWIEIYNPNEFEVNVTGLSLHDLKGEIFSFPSIGIEADSYYLVNLAKSVLLNCSADTGCSESVNLKAKGLVLDSYTYSDTEVASSWSLTSQGNWVLDYPISPGEVNIPAENKSPIPPTESKPQPKKETVGVGLEIVRPAGVERQLEIYEYVNPSLQYISPEVKQRLLMDFNPGIVFMIGLLVSVTVLAADLGLFEKVRAWQQSAPTGQSPRRPSSRTHQPGYVGVPTALQEKG